MNVIEIKNPRFLKKLNNHELENLAYDIREFIVDKVSQNGGHLSSNLGIVDLTIALHKVFDAPKDKIVFDVSHQCYTHKILTGRASHFDKLRKLDGLSGFQKRNESEYDCYEAGHSSTSLSAALGMSLARDHEGKKYNVIAVIGDGSMGNGLAYEALNHIGSTKTKLIIILNDNEMSISQNVGALHNNLDRIRAGYKYNNAKDNTKEFLNKIPFIGKKISSGITSIKDSFKKLYLKDGFLFEEMGIKYYGPINGHDYNEMITYFNLAKKEKSPVIIHVITKKGKGYKPCEEDNLGVWHGTQPFDRKTGHVIKKNDNLISWSEVVSNHLIRLTKENKDIMVITPAMAGGSKLLKYKDMFPKNFIDVGIAEEHALILANGLATNKVIPYVCIYSTFLQRGYDQVIHDIARMKSHVILLIDRCGIVGEDGETHQGIYDLTFLLPIPNIVISTPSNSIEAQNLLYTSLSYNKPFAIRYSKDKLLYEKGDYQKIKIGSWIKLFDGKDGVIISYGYLLNKALKVRDLLNNNYDIGVVNALFQKPIDEEMFDELLSKYKNIFVYEEQTIINSLGSYLLEYASIKGYKGRIHLFAIPDKYVVQGTKEEVLTSLGLDEDAIKNNISDILKK